MPGGSRKFRGGNELLMPAVICLFDSIVTQMLQISYKNTGYPKVLKWVFAIAYSQQIMASRNRCLNHLWVSVNFYNNKEALNT